MQKNTINHKQANTINKSHTSRISSSQPLLFRREWNGQVLDCYREFRSDDILTGIQFRDCRIDYTKCPNQLCIKKLS